MGSVRTVLTAHDGYALTTNIDKNSSRLCPVLPYGTPGVHFWYTGTIDLPFPIFRNWPRSST